eukprot:CAMPEP_0115131226 /NCGR_PEP_ID=MMETSP0227-20121206/52976_1 /TAXON_ID=89957 /ORGANISM="Polarella glacialis, Strain CCMP 1383" /LENGTH=64 /DNA_ID=CAMNT_0002536677 /DNA_START=29 /DNA_END=220 /DNA_ORIENTATION=+
MTHCVLKWSRVLGESEGVVGPVAVRQVGANNERNATISSLEGPAQSSAGGVEAGRQRSAVIIPR